MRVILAALGVFVSASIAHAAQWHASVATGVLLERGNDNVTESLRLPLGFGAGLRVRPVSARVEYSLFRATDGNATLSVTRSHEQWLAWFDYDFTREFGREFGDGVPWIPYVALGTGVGRTQSETRMLATVDQGSTSWAGIFAGAIGLRSEWSAHFTVRPEFRYESAESYKTKDARMGAFMNLDFVF